MFLSLPTTHDRRQYRSIWATTSRHSAARSLRSSPAPLLQVPFKRTSFGQCSFNTAATSVWNSLPHLFWTVTLWHYLKQDAKLICYLLFWLIVSTHPPEAIMKLRHHGAEYIHRVLSGAQPLEGWGSKPPKTWTDPPTFDIAFWWIECDYVTDCTKPDRPV